MCSHMYSLQYHTELFFCPKQSSASPLYPSLLPLATTDPLTTDPFTTTIVLPFPEFYIVGVMRYAAFSDWLLLTCVRGSSMSFLAR